MYLRSASIHLFLTLVIFATPAFSHSGHTTIYHSHSGIEYFLALLFIGAIIYRYIKK